MASGQPGFRYKAREDVLSEVLGTLRLRSRVFCRSDFSAPWAMTLAASPYAHFHVIERGGAWIRLDGERRSLALAGGDLIVVPHGRGHTLSASPNARPVPLDRIPRQEASGHYVVRHGGGGAETRMICGSFEFDRMAHNPVLGLLPPVLHVRGGGGSAEWLDPLLKLLASEARVPRPGSGTVIARLTDIIFVQAVRSWVDEQADGAGGWLGALRDPQIGAALALLHRAPERAWSVATLAAEVGMSRSPLAARFKSLVGEPPLSYLTRWRMDLVARLMESEKLTLREMAERVGYESEAAFSKAFKRHFQRSPREYRRALPVPAAVA
jgi:AraC-like DNA-binding protein